MPGGSIQLVLLADIGEILGALIGLFALVFWVIQKIVEVNKQAAAPRPRPAPPEVQAGAEAGMRPAGQQADPLRNQVEEFLRRAGGARQPGPAGAPPRQRPRAARGIEVLLDEEPGQAQRRPVGAPLRATEARPAAAQLSAAAPPPIMPVSDKRPARRSVVPRKRVTLAERADKRAAVRSQSMAKQGSDLGQRIIEDDQQFDVQLKAKFDHTVGTLASSTTSAAEPVSVASESPAAKIAEMLASPDGVRQAIIVNEILRRPTDRW